MADIGIAEDHNGLRGPCPMSMDERDTAAARVSRRNFTHVSTFTHCITWFRAVEGFMSIDGWLSAVPLWRARPTSPDQLTNAAKIPCVDCAMHTLNVVPSHESHRLRPGLPRGRAHLFVSIEFVRKQSRSRNSTLDTGSGIDDV